MTQELLEKELYDYIKQKYNVDEKKAKIVMKVAESLHQKCVKENCSVPKPVEWFLHEKDYREKWLQVYQCFDKLPDDKFKEMFYTHNVYNMYLKFMHEQFTCVA